MPTKTCCVTGHRDIPVEQMERVEAELRALIHRAINAGYGTFISGFARGVDRIFARLVLVLQAENPIRLEAAIPYAGQLKSRNLEFQSLLARCSAIDVIYEEYAPDCFFARNQYMVEKSDAVIAVYDGRQRGGTYQTIRYAREAGRKIAFVHVTPP